MKPFLVLGCVSAALTAHAQGVLTLTPSSVDLTVHPYTDRADCTFPTPSVSLANYTTIQLVFNAPAGYAWRVQANSVLECYADYGSWPSSGIGYGGTGGSLDSVPGYLPHSLSDPSWDSETGFGFDDHFSFGATLDFSSLTITIGHSVTQDMYQRQLLPSPFSQAYLDGGSGLQSGGLSLVPIPEPSVLAFAVLWFGVASYRRFRATSRRSPGRCTRTGPGLIWFTGA